MPTIRDVARAAQVSTSTVSHVINQTRHVNQETRQRVLKAMEDLDYRPNRLARSLRSNQTFIIGVIVPNSANPFFAEILQGIEEACFEHGYNIIMGNANDDVERELQYIDVLLARQVDGLLLISTGAYEASIERLKSNNTPTVMVDRSSGIDAVDEIFTANRQGGLLATNHLIALGHVRIGCITGPSHLTPSADRVAGYYEALQNAGLAADEDLIITGNFQHEGGYRACQQLLQNARPPTAIFACNDLMAVGSLRAIHEAGLRVPENISVVGYDDVPLASYTIPRLTTVAQPANELGQLAANHLIARVNGERVSPIHEQLPVHLIERDSCRTNQSKD